MSTEEERYTCDQWDEVEFLIRTLIRKERLGYVLLTEVRGKGEADVSVGRVDVPDESAGDDDDIMYALMDDAPESNDPADHVLASIQSELTDHMTGQKTARFRIKCMGHKGVAHLKSRTVVIVDTTFDDSAVPSAPLPGIPSESRELGNLRRAGEVRHQLDNHDNSRRVADLLIEGMREVQQLSTSAFNRHREATDTTLQRLMDENAMLRSSNERLIQQMAETSAERERQLTARLQAEADRATMEKTLDRAMETLGDALKVGMAAKFKLDPNVLDTLQVLSDNDKVMGALRDPKVRKLLENPEMQDGLAEILNSAAHPDAEDGSTEQQAVEGTPPAPQIEQAPLPPSSADEPGADPNQGDPLAQTQPGQDAEADAFNHPIPDVPDAFLESE